ncbi:efflux RND transporter periplasmic adaptor subunit [Terrarubrum flagellatum]|uniref:efflux RND transporter periplasmic adaptor subunit n=1 Tax=Terrirubrum flagellatum TaxID=2895980 RepID=UPI003144FDEF
MSRRWAPALLAASVTVLGVAAHAQQRTPAVTVAKPVVKEIVEFDDFIGRFEAVDQVDVRARVSGYVDKISFADGALVKAGDPLFTIDQRPYQAALAEAQASVESAQARVEYTTSDLQRAESLRRTGNIAGQLFDERTQAASTAKADLRKAEATLNRVKLDLEFTEIKAPISGRISRRLVSIGNLVGANDTVLTNIVSTDPINFYFDIDERSFLAYGKMGSGGVTMSSADLKNDVLVATADQDEPTLKGHIDFSDNRLDQESGTLRGRAVVPNPNGLMKPGQFGRVRLLGTDRYKGILIPEEALASDQDRRVVYVVGDDNVVTLKPVRTGSRVDGYRVIRAGLTGDERIVVNGLMRVRPGVKVEPTLATLPPTRAAAQN